MVAYTVADFAAPRQVLDVCIRFAVCHVGSHGASLVRGGGCSVPNIVVVIWRGSLTNLFENLPRQVQEEEFRELHSRPGVRIERIVSNGQFTPVEAPYSQTHDEWVLLLRGSAGLWIDGEGERELCPGDYILIPAHRVHRVTKTATNESTVWLAIHFC